MYQEVRCNKNKKEKKKEVVVEGPNPGRGVIKLGHLFGLPQSLGSFSSDDGAGKKNVTWK